jgi:hypothetical protein
MLSPLFFPAPSRSAAKTSATVKILVMGFRYIHSIKPPSTPLAWVLCAIFIHAFHAVNPQEPRPSVAIDSIYEKKKLTSPRSFRESKRKLKMDGDRLLPSYLWPAAGNFFGGVSSRGCREEKG